MGSVKVEIIIFLTKRTFLLLQQQKFEDNVLRLRKS